MLKRLTVITLRILLSIIIYNARNTSSYAPPGRERIQLRKQYLHIKHVHLQV